MAGYICGFYYTIPSPNPWAYPSKFYIPQVALESHTTILSATSRTKLTQTFVNPSETKGIKEIRYTFPLYDGVSVVGFTCRVGNRVIVGEVKEKEKARKVFQKAVSQGQTAGLLEQLPDASDVFTTSIGNIPAGAELIVDITYLGELKHDAEVDGVRFTIPTAIAPRYGNYPGELAKGFTKTVNGEGIQITVDVEMAEGSFIQQMRSPSHPIAVSMGTTSVAPDSEPQMSRASATLSLSSAELDTDFVLQIVAKNTQVPRAILETHPTIPNQRALMTTLVPKFSLPPEKPEIVFICDRSGSMGGPKMSSAVSALKVFLKSLPIGVKFNICSFGSSYSFLWKKSKTYSQSSLDEAMTHVQSFQANFGGTEMYQPIKATIEQRFKDIPLEIMLLTDGEIWDQETLFSYLNKEVIESKASIRVFTLGIGHGVSHALIEGVARAGNGFSQAVGEGEKMESKVVRMLKGSLTPHVIDYTLEVKYEAEDDDFEIIEKVADSLNVKLSVADKEVKANEVKKPISLFDTNVDLDKDPLAADDYSGEARYAHLPTLAVPDLLQAPHIIPPLFSFNRTSVYILMGPESSQKKPRSVILRGTSVHGPLELEIPVHTLETPGETIHQLAAKKAIAELEEGRGWVTQAKDESGTLIKDKFESCFEDMIEREAVRLGVQFQVGGKWCSFVAVESNKSNQNGNDDSTTEAEWLDVLTAMEQQEEATSFFTCGVPLAAPAAGMPSPPPHRPTLSSSMRATESRPLRKTSGLGSARGFGVMRSAVPTVALGRQAPPPQHMPPARPIGGLFSTNNASSYGGPAPGPIYFSSTVQPCSRTRRDASLNEVPNMSKGLSAVLGRRESPHPPPPTRRSRSSESNMFAVVPSGPKLDALIELQKFEGFWEWKATLFAVIGVGEKQAEQVAAQNGYSKQVMATALAVAFFERKLRSEKGAWELVVEKAKGWLEGHIGGGGVLTLMGTVVGLFG
ncbi:VIT-domain-containing protein [Glonium stellatum]|uniref:VIT-domain-containing protein n=1 Tax=Glonium stellatum TaxID=574774 RepID=A0A8E2EUW6_9PEZI|nr:VIT-domain-containing protein [Glonium stellatum]